MRYRGGVNAIEMNYFGMVGNSVQRGQMFLMKCDVCAQVFTLFLIHEPLFVLAFNITIVCVLAKFCGAIESRNQNIFMKGTFSTVITFLVKVTQ